VQAVDGGASIINVDVETQSNTATARNPVDWHIKTNKRQSWISANVC
jgi:hypothetical protein